MPFGLCNTPATFQRLTNLTFADIINQFVTVYLDNFLVYSEIEEEHLDDFKKVFERTRESQLHWKLKNVILAG